MRHGLAALLFLVAACGGGGVAATAPATNDPGPAPQPQPDPQPQPPPPRADSQVLVLLEDPDDVDELDEFTNDFGGIELQQIGATGFFLLTVDEGTDLDQLIEDLDDDLRVIQSEPDYLGGSPEGGPGGLATFGSDLLDAIPAQAAFDGLDLASAHAASTGAGVVVAVVDTGVDPGHPFLAGRLTDPVTWFDFIDRDADPTEQRNFVDDDGDGVIDEQFGHGTFVASLVLAIAPDARVMPVRVLDAEGFGTASSVASGIVWAADMGAMIINVSVDVPESSGAVKKAIEYAKERGALVVAAAGNGALDDIIFPARFGDVIGVAASDAAGVLAPFSNHGSQVSLLAPGVDMIGAVPESLHPPGTARWNGTSFAAPVVSGTAALVWSAFPGFDVRDVIEKLETTARPVDDLNPGHGEQLGFGLVQPAAAAR